MSQPWLVMMPEGWRVGDCYTCQFRCASISGERYPGINPACPLANAKKAVEVKEQPTVWEKHHLEGNEWVHGAELNGRPVTLYAVGAEK